MNHDTHEFSDGRRIRVLGDNILIRTDKPKDVSDSGLIVFPGGAIESVENTGTILAFGYEYVEGGKRKIPIPGLEVGMKCVFIRFLAEQDSNKQIRARFEDNVIRIKPSDIMFCYV